MNPFQTYLQPSMENDQGPMTTEVEQKVEQDLNTDVVDTAITDEVAEQATKAINEQCDVELNNAVKTAETVTEAIASLESVYVTLGAISQERDTLSDTEVSFMRIALAGTAKSLGGTVVQLVPSIESDNYFERNDVVASMESIGAAMKAGAGAFIKAVIALAKKIGQWMKSVGTRVLDKAKLVRSKLRSWSGNLEVDFPNQYFKPGMTVADLDAGWRAAESAINALVELDIAKIVAPRSSATGVDVDALLNPYVKKITQAGHHMNKIGYEFEYVKVWDYQLKQNFEPKSGATTVIIPKSAFKGLDINLSDWIERQAALSRFIETNEQIVTELEQQESSQIDQDKLKMIKCGLTLGRTICQINAYIVTAIHLALTRSEKGGLSDNAKPQARTNANAVTKDGGDARVVNASASREVAVR